MQSGTRSCSALQADAIVWDFEAAVRNAGTGDRSGELLHRLTLHKVTVASVAFSPNDQHLVTLGGRDDNNIVVWDVATGEPICGAPAANDESRVVTWFNTRDDMLVTGGNYTLRLWEFDRPSRRVSSTRCLPVRRLRVAPLMRHLVRPDPPHRLQSGALEAHHHLH